MFAILRARVRGAGVSVSGGGLLSLLADSEGPDRHAPPAAHGQQNLRHRRVLTDNVAASFTCQGWFVGFGPQTAWENLSGRVGVGWWGGRTSVQLDPEGRKILNNV